MQSYPPAFLPPCLLPPFSPCANQGLNAGAYFPSPLFSRLHDLSRDFPFFPRSISPPAFLLNHLHPPNYRFFFCRSHRSRRRHVVTPRLHLSLLLHSTPRIATFTCRFIGNANFLAVHPSNKTSYSRFSRSFGHYPWRFRRRRRINCKNKYE